MSIEKTAYSTAFANASITLSPGDEWKNALAEDFEKLPTLPAKRQALRERLEKKR